MEGNQKNNPDLFQQQGTEKDSESSSFNDHNLLSKGTEIGKSENINPNFDDLGPINGESLDKAETIINHFNKHLRNFETKKKQKENPFPVEIFPARVQRIIIATNESLNYPIDFIGASLLYAASVAIGNTHWVEIKNGFRQNAVMYLALVGRPGTNKSHPLSFALDPITQRGDLKYQEYERKKQEYHRISSLEAAVKSQYDKPEKPILEQYLVSDFTPEALADVHQHNKRGLGVYSDELASWVNNFGRYNKGSEEQFWLSAWSGKSIIINRKQNEPIYISVPFISVGGTIQPGVLDELAKKRTQNGFLDRILFVVPDDLKKVYWSETELKTEVKEDWNTIVSKILDVSIDYDETLNPQPEILSFSPEAKQFISDWQRGITDLSNEAADDTISGIYAKMELYALRLALCLEIMQWAAGNGQKQFIGVEATRGAIKLVEYFIKSALKVHTIISNDDPVSKLPGDKQNLYEALPNTFTTSDGIEIAEGMNVSKRTFQYFIKNKDLFSKPKRGKYEKRI
ncbi:DUF3987 domain-containing protein [Membranihabitans maritimus]|uniref:DUF3987 domain-containing protein n=1 Tax=Membranihabitans maritimus TaxID=2904244 RepID=UPI001F2EC340|nr:DUF3987 domain-containing protein [Membranihabitans maritimus]